MRPNEFMIGDYLTFPDVQNDPLCSKLKVVGMIGEDVYISNQGDPVADVYAPEHLAGIPLTPEILEKNGFEKSGKNFILADDYYDVTIYQLSDGIWTVIFHNIEMAVPEEMIHVSFVHQFQQFLRLVGIEKEIEL